jgi:hypothetical protein
VSELEPTVAPTTDEPVQSYVVIADIVGYSEASQVDQAKWIEHFLSILRAALDEAVPGRRNLFPTGDGAILCTYPAEPTIMEEAAACPLNFARALLKANRTGPFKLRISINYSPRDTLLNIASYGPLHTDYIQVGDGINLAERALHFAEPNEIVYTESYWNCRRVTGLLDKLSYYPHRSVFVKHMREMRLYSYRPRQDELAYIYAPPDPSEQHFKRFAYFPPLQSRTIERFRRVGLRDELAVLCNYAYDSIAVVNTQSAFISWSDIYDILIRLQGKSKTRSLVLSRADQRHNFWSTDSARSYMDHLLWLKKQGLFNQARLFIYDPRISTDVARDDVADCLRELHNDDVSLRKLHKAHLGMNVLSNYLFGVTIFPELECAVAPIPAPRSYNEYIQTLGFTDVHKVALGYSDLDFGNTSFKALVLADPDSVQELVHAFDRLCEGPVEDV